MSGINGKVMLVGHRLGGMVISAVAEKTPSKIEKLVFLAAYLTNSGQSLFGLASHNPDSQLGKDENLIMNNGDLTVDVKRAQIINIFIPDGSTQIQGMVLKNYRAEPGIPIQDTVALTSSNSGSVEKVYIKTLQDIIHEKFPAQNITHYCLGKLDNIRSVIVGTTTGIAPV